MSGTVNANVTANVAQFQAAMAQAAAAAQAFASSVNGAQAQAAAGFATTGAAARTAATTIQGAAATAGAAASGLSGTISQLGLTASFTARGLSALIDESVAGRWRQFDGTLARVVLHMAAANLELTAMVAAAAAAAAAVGYLAYEWIATTNAIKQAANEMVIMGTGGTDSIARITASIKQSREEMDLWPGESRKVEESLRNLPPAADGVSDRIKNLGIEIAKLSNEDVVKTTNKLVEQFAKGGKATEEWANKYHLLDNATVSSGQSLKQYVADAVAAGHDQDVFNAVIKAAEKRFGEYGKQIIEADIALRQWMRDAAMAEGSGGAGPMPEPPKLPTLKIDPAITQEQNAVDKLNVELNRRNQAMLELKDAQNALNRAQSEGDLGKIAIATEAVATAEKKLNEIHTTTEQNAHRATQAVLEEAAAAAKDGHERVAAAKALLDETTKYYKEGSNEQVAARKAVSAAEKAAGIEDYRVQSLKYEQQIVDARGNLGKQKKIYDEWLAYAKTIYKEDTTEYQQILLKREELLHRHTGAGVDMTKEEFRQEIAAADGNYKEQLKIEDQLLAYLKQKYGERSKEYQKEALHRIEIANREAKQEATIAADAARTQEAIARSQERMAARLRAAQTGGQKFSLLDLLGFSSADTAAFEEQLNQVVEAHATAMAAIKKQQESAVNEKEMQTALNDEKRELQNFAEETQKIQLQEANAIKRAWQSVSDSIANDLGSSLVKMATGTQSVLRSIGSLIEQMATKILTWSFKMVGRWIIDRLLELHTSQATEAGKTAATAAGTATRTGIQAAATAKETGGFFIRVIKWIASELGMTGATTTGATTRTGEEIAADAKGAAATATTNVAKAQSNIGVAATAAAAAVAGIPVIGPGLAAGAAASMVATLEPFAQMAALDVGAWNVPRDMVAQIHKNEMVVPADFASGLRGQLSGTGPSNPISLNFQPNISMSGAAGGVTRNSVQTIMSMASERMYGYMRNVYRNGTTMLPGSRLG